VDFNLYLAYIISKCTDVKPEIRQLIGIQLKNNLKALKHNLSKFSKEYIQYYTILSLGDSESLVRNSASLIINSWVYYQGLSDWPNLIKTLVNILNQYTSGPIVEGVLITILNLIMDSPDELDSQKVGRPINIIIPLLIKYMGHSVDQIRLISIESIYSLLDLNQIPNSVISNMEDLLVAVFKLVAKDKGLKMRIWLCKIFVALLRIPKYIKNSIKDIFEFIMFCNVQSDESLALEACEFWVHITELKQCKDFLNVLKNYLPKYLYFKKRVIPILINGMMYSKSEIQNLSLEMNIELKDEDIAPQNFFIKPKVKNETNNNEKNENDILNDEDDEDDDYDDDEDLSQNEFNLRRCSASCLDNMSHIYQSYILEILLPIVKDNLNEKDWIKRECVILALGAVSDGLGEYMYEYLDGLVPILCKNLDDEQPLIAVISCWTVSKFANWILKQNKEYIYKVIHLILEKTLDKNKKIQEAALSSINRIQYKSYNSELIPFIGNCSF
jgi:transportin-1